MRALIPVGYMPGNLLEGEFVRLCPAGLPALTGHAGQDGHAGHHENVDSIPADVELSSVCPLGAALGQAGLINVQPAPFLPAAAAGLTAPATDESPPAPTGVAFRSRAPPAVLV